ncbi:MAG: pyridoxal-phosphate dependent enzyme [Anaerolineae bacterium]|nr:pyridoxal-phosphate dependent enzyme [Anaerolineae bacterium]
MSKKFSLTCANCSHRINYTRLIGTCSRCGEEWLDPVYDLDETAYIWQRKLPDRDRTMWRYWELLPILDLRNIVSMGEGWTPLLPVPNIGNVLGHDRLYVKDERQGPTASFKDRQASLAISVVKEANIDKMVVASTGNVAISYSAYCARAGIGLWAFLDSNVPHEKEREVRLYGTNVVKIDSTYDKTKEIAAQFAQHRDLYLDKGVKGLAAREAMKTLAFEVAEQMGRLKGIGWAAPDWYVQAVSGGMGPIGVWAGFNELYQMGLISKFPKLAIIQTDGCAPMVDSFHKGLEKAEVVEKPASLINVLSTGNPGLAYEYLRKTILTHGGAFVKVDDEASFKAMRDMAQFEGLSMEPAAAVACAGAIKMIEQQLIDKGETVVINASGHTFPIEKQILERRIIKHHTRLKVLEKDVIEDVKPTNSTLKTEGLLTALERLDDRVHRIAIIEDESDARTLLRRILEYRRYTVDEAPNGTAGIQLLRTYKPDLVLLDLMMPEMDGFDVIDEMEADEALRDIPVIVITAKDLTKNDYQRLSGKVESLLQKGEFLEENLFASINDVEQERY